MRIAALEDSTVAGAPNICTVLWAGAGGVEPNKMNAARRGNAEERAKNDQRRMVFIGVCGVKF